MALTKKNQNLDSWTEPSESSDTCITDEQLKNSFFFFLSKGRKNVVEKRNRGGWRAYGVKRIATRTGLGVVWW